MSLGLKKGTVRLEAHQAEWDIEGERACTKIRDILGIQIDETVEKQEIKLSKNRKCTFNGLFFENVSYRGSAGIRE